MKRALLLSSDEADVDMTPMLDIVFIMLIFFIVTSVFIRTSSIDLHRPSTEKGPPAVDAPMHIRVDADDQYWLGTQAIDARAIGARIEVYQASVKTPKLLIESHHSANTEALVYLVNAAKSVGLAQISVATYE